MHSERYQGLINDVEIKVPHHGNSLSYIPNGRAGLDMPHHRSGDLDPLSYSAGLDNGHVSRIENQFIRA